MTWAAVLGAALLAGLLVPRSRRGALARLVAAPQAVPSRRPTLRPVLLAAPVVMSGAALLLAGPRGAVLVAAAGCVAATAAAIVRRRRRRRRALARMKEVARACEVLASLVRIGHVPSAALNLAVHDSPVLAPAASVQLVGGDPVSALRRAGQHAGSSGLVRIAEAWEVSAKTGAPVVATLDAVTDELRAVTDLAHVVDSELAAPRATGQLLAALPFAGLAMGLAVGGDPIGFLTGSLLGQACLLGGVGLACAGVLWSEALADRAAAGAAG